MANGITWQEYSLQAKVISNAPLTRDSGLVKNVDDAEDTSGRRKLSEKMSLRSTQPTGTLEDDPVEKEGCFNSPSQHAYC